MIPRLCPPIALSDLPRAFSLAQPVEHFEAAFAALAKTKHAIAFPYGRTALICLLEALGIADKEIICPSYTCVVVPHAVTYSRNDPVFVDCAPGSYLMDMTLAAEAVSGRTGAIIPTSFFGEPVSLEALDAFSRANPGVAIIQDCAHSFFCEDKGRPVHRHGIAAIYGLNVSKIMTSIFGGMVTTDDDALAARLRSVRAARIASATMAKSIARRLYMIASRAALTRAGYGTVKAISRTGLLDRFVKYYEDTKIDMPRDYREGLTGFEAAIGAWQCGRYHGIVAHRRKIAAIYHAALKDCAHLQLPAMTPGHTWSHYTIRTPDAARYIKTLAGQGVELGHMLEYFIPDMPVYRAARHIDRGMAKAYMGQTVNLPVHEFVDTQDAGRIARLMGGA